MLGCPCHDCDGATSCVFTTKVQKHSEQVTYLLSSAQDAVTLIVGQTKARIVCHKILLAYYSGYFNGLLYGSFAESAQAEITLLDDDKDDMRAFVNWVYTGNIFTCHPVSGQTYGAQTKDMVDFKRIPERMWVFGDRLLAPSYSNDSMLAIMSKYRIMFLFPDAAAFVYENTVSESKLRSFIRVLIRSEGPLARSDSSPFRPSVSDWQKILSKNGELLSDCILYGLANKDVDNIPYGAGNRHLYFENDPSPPVADWFEAKGTQK
ncbi:uncharacterized protein LY89DRAFT_665474 [Mollisia scopiformis]|uniref:BTB domain-containing protein n=1 Tax=Mollisia scopiformis TaxID=149040 RepID=A0A194XLJ6_MOLSC|nr:uncharacterized protein LY89DRAFT_665474 [Mollisia scopiformis]KUJ21006.1 hypothetical protein LY89DRAFT_665474 [Mollisia scopiformis]